MANPQPFTIIPGDQERARRKRPETVAELARQCFDDADGDAKEATDRMEAAIRKDRMLRDALTDPLIRQACYTAISAQVRSDRKISWAPSEKPLRATSIPHSYRAQQVADDNLLMMFPLLGGKIKLKDATRREILEAVAFYDQQATDMAWKARWMRSVASALPDETKRVGKVLTEARLREMKESARAA